MYLKNISSQSEREQDAFVKQLYPCKSILFLNVIFIFNLDIDRWPWPGYQRKSLTTRNTQVMWHMKSLPPTIQKLWPMIFYAPASIDPGYLVFGPSICLSAKTLNIGHIFRLVRLGPSYFTWVHLMTRPLLVQSSMSSVKVRYQGHCRGIGILQILPWLCCRRKCFTIRNKLVKYKRFITCHSKVMANVTIFFVDKQTEKQTGQKLYALIYQHMGIKTNTNV